MHPKKQEEKYKLERARLEQELSYQRRILEEPNKIGYKTKFTVNLKNNLLSRRMLEMMVQST